MSTIKKFIQGHPVLSYYVLTFLISWGGTLMAIGPSGVLGTSNVPEELMPFVYLAMLLGPSVAGLLVTGLIDGRVGFRELLSRLFRWRVSVQWYAIALLTVPLLITVILLALSLTSPIFLPVLFTTDDKAGILVTGIVMGLAVGFFEELGWTGFAMPRIRQRYGVLTTGLIMGFLWGLWHFPLFLGSVNSSRSIPPTFYLSVLLFSFLPAYRVFIVWLYDRTGSVLMAMLAHVPLAASQMILIPMITGASLVAYDLIFAAVLWVFVAAVQKQKTLSAAHIMYSTLSKERG